MVDIERAIKAARKVAPASTVEIVVDGVTVRVIPPTEPAPEIDPFDLIDMKVK